MTNGVGLMGRPKTGLPKPAREDTGERETVIHMKGSAEYVEWLEAINKKTHIPKVQVFRIAVREWAERNKHPLPPEI